jgi:hypothetical protein
MRRISLLAELLAAYERELCSILQQSTTRKCVWVFAGASDWVKNPHATFIGSMSLHLIILVTVVTLLTTSASTIAGLESPFQLHYHVEILRYKVIQFYRHQTSLPRIVHWLDTYVTLLALSQVSKAVLWRTCHNCFSRRNLICFYMSFHSSQLRILSTVFGKLHFATATRLLKLFHVSLLISSQMLNFGANIATGDWKSSAKSLVLQNVNLKPLIRNKIFFN